MNEQEDHPGGRSNTRQRHASRLLRGNKAFRALWTARVVSFAGDRLTLVALILLVHARHGSGMAVAALMFAVAVPRLLGPVAGAIVDRVDQRRLMRVCELGRAVVVTVIALTLPPLPILLALVAVTATLANLFMPAGRSVVPGSPVSATSLVCSSSGTCSTPARRRSAHSLPHGASA